MPLWSWLLAARLFTAASGAMAVAPDDDAAVTGALTVQDEAGRGVATLDVRPGRFVSLSLPAGTYRLVDARGHSVRTVTSDGKAPVVIGKDRPTPRPRVPTPEATKALDDPLPPDDDGTRRHVGTGGPDSWKRWGAPLLSAITPGVGQGVAGKGGRALAIFATMVGLGLGTAALVLTDDPTQGAARGDRGDSVAQEVARLGALSALTTGLGMLYLGQIFDAHALGRGRPAEAKRDFAVALFVQRFSTIGMRPGEPSHALYDDFGVTLMGQVVQRVTVGVGDMSAKLGDRRGAYVIQGGPRAMWRFFDRKRIWLEFGGGVILQGASSPGQNAPIESRASADGIERAFGAIPYAQFQAQWFLLDRWSLGLAPRVSVPLTDRYYARGAKISRFSTTFELGGGVGVHF